MHCPMCHLPLYAEAQAQACRSCPLYRWTRGCHLRLIRCPRCGYHSLPEEPTERATASQASQVAKPLPRQDSDCGAACPLSELAVGAWARLVSFNGLKERDLQRLVAYGLVPGVRLKMLQRVPTYILKIHETELALEEALAAAIYVTSEEPIRSASRPVFKGDARDETAS